MGRLRSRIDRQADIFHRWAISNFDMADSFSNVFHPPTAITDTGPDYIGPDSSPLLPPLVPSNAERYLVPPGGSTDNIGSSLMNFLTGVLGSAPEVDYIYGPDSIVSERFWQHHAFLAPFRDWFYNGSRTFCKSCDGADHHTYWSGLHRVQYTVPGIDVLRDILVNLGLDPLEEGLPYRDWPIEQFGSFTVDYQGSIDCPSKTVKFHAVIFNAWSLASGTRSPVGRWSVLSGGRRVYEQVIIDKTGPACG